MKNSITRVLRRLSAALFGVMALAAACAAQAQVAIQGVSSSLQGGLEVVKIDLSQPLAALPSGSSASPSWACKAAAGRSRQEAARWCAWVGGLVP